MHLKTCSFEAIDLVGLISFAVIWLFFGVTGFFRFRSEFAQSAGGWIIVCMSSCIGPFSWLIGWFEELPNGRAVALLLYFVSVMSGTFFFYLNLESICVGPVRCWQISAGLLLSAVICAIAVFERFGIHKKQAPACDAG